MMLAACSRVSLAGFSPPKQDETKTSVIKNVFIVLKRVDRREAAKIPKHLWLLVRLSQHGRLEGCHVARGHVQHPERQRLRPSRRRVCRASSPRKHPCARYALVKIRR